MNKNWYETSKYVIICQLNTQTNLRGWMCEVMLRMQNHWTSWNQIPKNKPILRDAFFWLEAFWFVWAYSYNWMSSPINLTGSHFICYINIEHCTLYNDLLSSKQLRFPVLYHFCFNNSAGESFVIIKTV